MTNEKNKTKLAISCCFIFTSFLMILSDNTLLLGIWFLLLAIWVRM
ncbi:MAG: hypothetical protein AABY22_22970 [Nanoarchaeota archaeon]